MLVSARMTQGGEPVSNCPRRIRMRARLPPSHGLPNIRASRAVISGMILRLCTTGVLDPLLSGLLRPCGCPGHRGAWKTLQLWVLGPSIGADIFSKHHGMAEYFCQGGCPRVPLYGRVFSTRVGVLARSRPTLPCLYGLRGAGQPSLASPLGRARGLRRENLPGQDNY